ncbi:hypothetical protein GS481_02435 [Rhodococcus hoagii]|nr:hypothetical protein [Prescottella equi]
MADGVIYECFDPARHVVDNLPTMQRVLAVGVDYGTTNPTRGIKLGLGDDNRCTRWPSGRLELEPRPIGRPVCAPSAPPTDPTTCSSTPRLPSSRSSCSEADGVGGGADSPPPYANGMNRVGAGIGLVSALLSTDQLLIHSSCTELLGEIPGYVWDTKAAQKGRTRP